MTCEICDYADEHGSWSTEMLQRRMTHCRDCHKTWSGAAKAHCVRCHETFRTNATADLHWAKEGHVHPVSLCETGVLEWREDEQIYVRHYDEDDDWLSRIKKQP